MSQWTHVNASFRLNSIGEIPDEEIIDIFGKQVDYRGMSNIEYILLPISFPFSQLLKQILLPLYKKIPTMETPKLFFFPYSSVFYNLYILFYRIPY